MKPLPLVLCGVLALSSLANASSRSQRDHGAEVFASTGCRTCHTIQNVGGKRGPDLSGVGRSLSKDKIRTQILDGSKQMPPFKDVLAPNDVNDLVAYLKSCKQKPQKP